eukprot:ANDGO_03114.mRNA.1 hypothetical protein
MSAPRPPPPVLVPGSSGAPPLNRTAPAAPPPPYMPATPGLSPSPTPSSTASRPLLTTVPLQPLSAQGSSSTAMFVKKPQAPVLSTSGMFPGQGAGAAEAGAPDRKNAGHKSLLDGLTVAPWAHYMAYGVAWAMLLQGFIALTQYHAAVGPGVYALVISLIVLFLEWASLRCKKLSEDEEVLGKLPWPRFLLAAVNVFQNHLVKALAYLAASIYLYFATTTLVSGFTLSVNSFIFLAAFVRKEKSQRITGKKF